MWGKAILVKMVLSANKTVSANDSNILPWKSKGLSNESIKAPTTSNKILNLTLNFVSTKIRVKFNGDCLK